MSSDSAIAAVITAVLLLSPLGVAGGDTVVYNTDGLRNAIYAASPGDRICMAGPGDGGQYNTRLYVDGVHGEPGNMIEVVAWKTDDRPVFTSDTAACFTLNRCSYILVDGIIGEHGGTASQGSNNIEFANSDHMIIKNSLSRWIDHNGNSDAYKFASSSNVLMYNCVADTWADGGSGVDIMNNHNSLFMRNTFTYPALPDYAGANGFQPKADDAYELGFYKNTFEDGSSRPQQFGGSSGAPEWEGRDMVAMGSTFHLGEAAVAFVSCTQCEFAYNTVLNPEKWVMRILNENTGPGADYWTAYNTFRRNLVQYDSGLMDIQNVGSSTRPETFTYAENYWYNSSNPGTIPALPGGETDPAGGTNPQLDADYRPQLDAAKDYGAHAPAMEAAFEQYVGWFQWAWDLAQLFEPKAAAGGPYEVGPGGTISLDGSSSYAGAGSYEDYSFDSLQWDLDGDGAYDRTGQAAQVSYDELVALGVGFGTHLIELKATVTNEYNTIWDLGFAELAVVNHPAIAGDANADNVVDGGDYTAWADHYGEQPVPAWADGGWSIGNFTDDDVVDGADYTVWADNYLPAAGKQAGTGAGAVPEPTSAALMAPGLVALLRRRRHRMVASWQ